MNAIEIRDLSKSYKDFNLEHMNLTLPGMAEVFLY